MDTITKLLVGFLVVAIASTLLSIGQGTSAHQRGEWQEHLTKNTLVDKIMAVSWAGTVLILLYMNGPMWLSLAIRAMGK